MMRSLAPWFLLLLLTPALLAGDKERRAALKPSSGYAMSLFDGKTLHGWKVTGCEAVVENGELLLKSGDGLVRTHAEYGDFILEFEWKPLLDSKWDSGIYIRAAAPSGKSPWPKKYQINLLEGHEGRLLGFDHPNPTELIKKGDWNRFRITVVGDTASMVINGQPAWKVSGLEASHGYIGFQSEVDGGGQFLFRDITITELDHKSLLGENQLEAWEGAGGDPAASWKLADGVLEGTVGKGPWLRSREQFGDFNLRLEYRIGEGKNSGVYIRVPESGNHHGAGAGIEVQLLDDPHPSYAKLKKYQYTGSLYAIAPSQEHVGLPAGEWNTMEIDAHGQHYRVIHNGVTIIAAGPEDYPQLTERNVKGFLGLQNHGGGVAFRRLRIGPSLQE
ncbi:3-keto-disaccharide hydrolase [Lignipirellula cremea]|uniref:3-keto-alpha-glucoside-1,2-lyase/3-keto-2-hydroxy-glucal hydratase domain-containing protein n=1 Tax=Lignipirellula cremea TaxID=2528010 RepID=A0A518DY36_9BACT|nr:DUF1080 domain-containing protein [Lignipirellula cremea]QDU96758.1 hypothetical protein Pla8534_45790 [Lignipirellula cremea]